MSVSIKSSFNEAEKYTLIENTSKAYRNGSVWDSNKCGKFKIIGKTNKYFITKDNKKSYRQYVCEFEDGAIVLALSSHIKRGLVRSPNYKSLYDTGYLGIGKWSVSIDGAITKEYVVWSEMIRRCYAPNASLKFPAYTEVTVCDRWHCFQYFCEDIVYLKGYENWKKAEDVKYHLDKDILCQEKTIIPKIYSPETCLFITAKENISESSTRKNLTGLTYIGTCPNGEAVEFINMSKFSKENKLTVSRVHHCINNNGDSHKGWTFKVKS